MLVCVQVAAQLSNVSCYLLSWRSQGVLLAFQGGPDCTDIWRTGPRWPVGLFCAEAVTATVRLCFVPLSLFLSIVSIDLVSGCHTFLSLSLFFMFHLSVLYIHLVPSLSHFHFLSLLSGSLFLSLSILSLSHSHIFPL